MKRYSLIVALLVCFLPCRGQHFDPGHRHSIEISTGIPPLQTFLLSGGSVSYRMESGINESTNFRGCINIGYTFAINEKWDVNFVFDLCGQHYTRKQYPMVERTMEDGYLVREPDFKSDPTDVKDGVRVWPSYMVDFRWKWYRTDSIRLYSSFGLSYLPFVWPIFPSITPIGINFGSGHFYGVAELNLSTAATLALVGAGYRF